MDAELPLCLVVLWSHIEYKTVLFYQLYLWLVVFIFNGKLFTISYTILLAQKSIILLFVLYVMHRVSQKTYLTSKLNFEAVNTLILGILAFLVSLNLFLPTHLVSRPDEYLLIKLEVSEQRRT